MNGVYGTVKPANINIENDVEIFYSFKPSRNDLGKEREKFHKISDPILESSQYDDSGKDLKLNGMFNLKLPASIFGEKGIYTLYIRPKELKVKIIDVSILAAYPDVRGVVFNVSNLDGIDDLTGYRLEFIEDGDKGDLRPETRLITSCSPCTPIQDNANDRKSETIRYVFSDTSSDLLFCTVTPSLSLSFKPNYIPYIGTPNIDAILVNTKFDPVMIEIEMVEHDIETVSTMLEGSQVRDLDRGRIITFNNDKSIYSSHEYFTLKDSLGEPMYDVKVKKGNFDGDSAEYLDIIDK